MSSHYWLFATANSAQSAASRFLVITLDILREKSFILLTVAKAKGCFSMTGKSDFSHSPAKGHLLTDSTAGTVSVPAPSQPPVLLLEG